MTTFDTLERSIDQGAPIELYEFAIGPVTWRYTNAAAAVPWNAFTWQPMQAGERDEIQQSGEPVRAQVRLKAMPNHPVVQLYVVYPPSVSVLLTIRELHAGAGDADASWVGRVSSVVPGDVTCDIVCESFLAGMSTTGLRRRWQTLCPHALYGPACRAPPVIITGALISVNGASVQCAGFATYPDGKFAGGYLTWLRPEGWAELRDIDTHVGDIVTLRAPIRGLAAGDFITGYIGCSRMMQACNDDHGNILNFGGFNFVPKTNPFGNQSVF